MTRPFDVAAADWVAAITDDEIARVCGEFALERGWGYADAERVRTITTGDRGRMVLSTVAGSRSTPYSTMITTSGEGSPPEWQGRCSCPVGRGCKHVVATLLLAREQLGGTAPPLSSWRATLAPYLGTTREQPAERTAAMGLVVALHRRPASLGSSRPVDVVELRPTRRTRTGHWSRTFSWAELRSPRVAEQLDERQVAALKALDDAELGGGWTGYSTRSTISLNDANPSVWAMLQRALDAGVELVPDGDLAGGRAELAPPWDGAAEVAGDDGDLVLTLGLRGVAGERRFLLGDPGHGLAVADGHHLTLVPLQEPATPLLRHLVQDGDLRVPEADVPEFTALYLPRLRESMTVHHPGADDVEPLGLHLHLQRAESSTAVLVTCEFDYGSGLLIPCPLTPTRPGRRRRDELALVDELSGRLHPLGLLEQVGGMGWWPLGEAEVTDLDAVRLIQAVDDLAEHERVTVQLDDDLPAFEELREAPVVEVGTVGTGDPDWFDLQITVSIDGQAVALQPLFTGLARGDTQVMLPTGAWFRLDHPSLDRLREVIQEARFLEDVVSSTIQINRYQVGLWEELATIGVVAEQATAWQQAVERLRTLDVLDAPPTPSGLQAELRPYQQEGFAWLSTLWDADLGGVLADDMGLGKTVQTLAALVRAKEAGDLGGDAGPVLIVAPTSVVGTWVSEAARFAPELAVTAIGATARRRKVPLAETAGAHDVLVTSYAVLRHDAQEFADLTWRGLVLDEAQTVKNHQSQTYRAARRVSARFRLAVSGTPLENSLMDLWSLFSIVAPGLYPDPVEFNVEWRRPIESGAHPELLDRLRRRVRPLMLRRTKSQVAADLPTKQVQVMEVPLTAAHQRVYDQRLARERQRIMGLLNDPDANRIAILASLTRLRQLSLDPALVDPDQYGALGRSAKASALSEQLREIREEGHRALVFSQFTTYLQSVQRALTRDGVSTRYLDGTMTAAQRTAEIDAFRGGDATAFLLSLKAGGTGLTLTEADYVFVLDPWWNPAAEAQAVDRTHRIGQERPVMVYRMVSKTTIEEKVVALQERKRDLFERVVDDGGSLSGAITADDLKQLLD